LKGNKYEVRYKELDYVLKRNNRLIIGELKVSNKNPVSTAVEQLVFSQQLLRHINKSVQIYPVRFPMHGLVSSQDVFKHLARSQPNQRTGAVNAMAKRLPR
jgi:hypothetical protein